MAAAASGPPPRARIGLLELNTVDGLLDLQSGLGAGALAALRAGLGAGPLVCLAIDPDDRPVDIDDPDPDRRAQLGGVARIAGGIPEVELPSCESPIRVAVGVLAKGEHDVLG